jgi:hypothetical protein
VCFEALGIPDPLGNHRDIKLGFWLKATASGRFAIAASVLIVVIVPWPR